MSYVGLPQTEDAYRLLHEGAVALAHISHNGMRVDTEYLDRAITSTRAKIDELSQELKGSDFWRQWRRKYGDKANFTSRPQLGDMLFNEMGFVSKSTTATGRYKTDVEALEGVDHPFVRDYVRLAKLDKLHGTYLTGLRREVVGEYVHPFFHLNTVWTMRGSSSDPNFQNLPIRDSEIAELIRSCFIPRPGHLIVENDFKGIEVCVAACYCRDPVLIDYVSDPTKDMHRDCAAKLFMVDDMSYWKTKEGKDCRYVAKNQYVFPGFYGSDWVNIAQGLWNGLDEKDVRFFGQPMKAHLADQGITELGDCMRPSRHSDAPGPAPGTFAAHVRDFEDWYWNVQYIEYTRWKREWHDSYLQKGWFGSHTGFAYRGVFDRNQVLNAPIQGSAFHLLLWVLIRLQKWMTKNNMRSKIVGQIHDSIIGDVHESERDAYLAKVKDLVSSGLRQYWDWIIVPLTVEAEVTPVDGNWFLKKEIKI